MTKKTVLDENGNPTQDNGLKAKSLMEAMATLVKYAQQMEESYAVKDFANGLDSAEKQLTKMVAPISVKHTAEWRFVSSKGNVHTFWNEVSSYQVNFELPKDSSKTEKDAFKYLTKYSALFSAFGTCDADLKTDLFNYKCYTADGKRVINFKPKKFKVFHQTAWGADVLSDVSLDIENLATKRQMVEVKIQIDKWDSVAGFIICKDGVLSAHPVLDTLDSFREKVKGHGDTYGARFDRASAPFVKEGDKK